MYFKIKYHGFCFFDVDVETKFAKYWMEYYQCFLKVIHILKVCLVLYCNIIYLVNMKQAASNCLEYVKKIVFIFAFILKILWPGSILVIKIAVY